MEKIDIQKKHADGSWVWKEDTTIKFMAQDKNTPIPSMYDIFITTFTTKIYQKVGKYTSPMDASWVQGLSPKTPQTPTFRHQKNSNQGDASSWS